MAEGGALPSWAPDGRQIAFTYGGWRPADRALNLDAAVIEVDDQARPVAAGPDGGTGYHEDFTPAWSPDGKWLASIRTARQRRWPATTARAARRRVPPGRGRGQPGDPAHRLRPRGRVGGLGPRWAPARALVLGRGGTQGVGLPWIVTIDPQIGTPTGSARLPLPATIQNAEWLAWSPRGDEIALDEKTSDRHTLWRVAADGTTAERLIELPPGPTAGSTGRPMARHWSTPPAKAGVAALRDCAVGGTPAVSPRSANLLHPQVSPDGA